MATTASSVLLFLVAVASILLLSSASGAHHHHHPQYNRMEIGAMTSYLSEEFELDSEWSRRILAATNYISYDALKRDSVPCSRRGASYYNCRPGASANPYTRGCNAITQCRS